MRDRCFNSKATSYKNYGGRGITICNEWLEFTPFRDWSLSNGYVEGLQIDRKETNGNYKPSNCHFVTRAKNCQNRLNNVTNLDTANEIRKLYDTGEYTQVELAKKYNVYQETISYIVNKKQWKD